MFIPHISKILLPSLTCLRRCWDRRCKLSIKKIIEDKNHDEVNSKKISMTELLSLYTGSQIPIAYILA